jgi:hypothetical protein
MKSLRGIFLVYLLFSLSGYDSEGEKVMKQLGIDERLASLTYVPPTKSALDVWHVGDLT